jgi:hypothetical protein
MNLRFSTESSMHSPNEWCSFEAVASSHGLIPSLASLFGYVGLGPGPDLIPYVMALLSFVGVAIVAVLQWPVSVMLGYLAKLRRRANRSHGQQGEETNLSCSRSDASQQTS